MIITAQKPFPEIIESLKNYKKIFIVGCAACATKCQTGGEEAVKKMAEQLVGLGKEVTGYLVLDTPCDARIVKKDLSKSEKAKQSDAILVLACGGGVQAISNVTDFRAIPALNPQFLGTIERIGIYNEFCSMCGDCMLALTGGICPVTRCAKSLVNGPCGGSVEGKCEVDPDRDCAWALIFEKLKKQGRSGDILKIDRSPKKFSKPKRIDNTKKL
jgi:hypothetical protein